MTLFIAVFISWFSFILNMILFARYIGPLGLNKKWNLILFATAVLLALCPLLASDPFLKFYGSWAFLIQQTCYTTFIGLCLLVSFTLMSDILRFLGRYLHFKWPDKTAQFDTMVACLTLIFTCWSIYQGNKLPSVRSLELFSPKITQEKTIAVLADLHISQTLPTQKIEKIVNQTNALKPDVIVLVGDMVDDMDKEKIAPKVLLLSKLQAPKGVYYVSGNHEFYTGYDQAMDLMRQAKITLLEHRGAQVDSDLYIGGIPDFKMYSKIGRHKISLKSIYDKASGNPYKILLSHTPSTFVDPAFDLELSGHTHGGQIFPFHLFSWWTNHGFLSGLYPMKNGAQIYVTNGVGQWGPQLRLFAESELTLIHLKPQNKTSD